MPEEGPRCPTCGALLAADARWCGQCFTPIESEPEKPAREQEPPPTDPRSAPADDIIADQEQGYWPCSVCGERNRLEADACSTCGTPFAQVMRSRPGAATIDPDSAFRRSLMFPGLGHQGLGRSADGFARSAVFVVALILSILLAMTAKTALAKLVFGATLVVAVATYVGSAFEARNLARGGGLYIGSRALLWILVGLVFVCMAVLGLSVATAVRG